MEVRPAEGVIPKTRVFTSDEESRPSIAWTLAPEAPNRHTVMNA
jgi:hypothetical protein